MQTFTPNTRRNYLSQISRYLHFTGDAAEEILKDPSQRDISLANYITHLRDTAQSRLSSINTTLTAIESFFRFLGVGFPAIKRERLACTPPRILTREERSDLLAVVADKTSAKERSVVLLFLSTGIRLGECAALNVSDASFSSHEGKAILSVHKDGTSRNLPLDEATRSALFAWLIQRERKAVESAEQALFVNNSGQRMSTQGLDLIVRKVGIHARLNLSAQVLRDTFLTEVARQSNDAFLVAKIAGHARLDSTRKYFDLAQTSSLG
jgi:integrase/recombinase XerC